MKYLFFCLFLLSIPVLHAQIVFDRTRHDFGELMPYDDRFIDIALKNTGEKQEYILRVVKPMEVVYISSGQFIEKDSTRLLRFQVNPKQKGRFAYDIEVFTSDRAEPVKIRLTGNMREKPAGDLASFQDCPDFSQQPGTNNTDFKLTVVVIDKATRAELPASTVSLIQNGRPLFTKKTDKNGSVERSVPLGFTYFYASHDQYHPAEMAAYVNFKRNYIVIELEKDPAVGPELPQREPEIVVLDTTELIVETNPELELEEQLSENETAVEVPADLASLDPDNFDESYFRPVNVVFVLDVSSSMRQADKIELMKFALVQLAEMLRPQDKMGIVTYSSDAEVLLESVSGSDKETIYRQVEALKAGGMTAGGDGIKLGFKEAKSAMIEGGANHVIIITDGAFNRNSDDYKKYIKKYARKGFTLSVVGIKNKENDEAEMRDAAELANGRYIPIFRLADAKNNLKQEIRLITFRGSN